jgi:hypothetical protein
MPVVLAILTVLLGVHSCFYNRLEPETVRSQLIAAGIMGQTLDSAVATLKQLKLPRGTRLGMGTFDPTTRELDVGIDDAVRFGWVVWYVRITLRFDADNRVDHVSAELAADINL